MCSIASTRETSVRLNNLNQHDKRDLDLARKSVQAARLLLLNGSTLDRGLEKIEDREWKIKADRKLESVILKVLQEGSDYPILSEESGVLAGNGTRQWIVDPLDGSVNYCRGIPLYCISVGLWEDKQPLLGVVLEIPSDRMFAGIVGVGAWCNDEPIGVAVEEVIHPSKAVLCTGLPTGFDHSRANLEVLVSVCVRFGKVRMLGSAALMMCYLASGRCDSYWESQIALWDIGAGLAIAQAAGQVTRLGKIGVNFRVDIEAASCDRLLVSEVYGK